MRKCLVGTFLAALLSLCSPSLAGSQPVDSLPRQIEAYKQQVNHMRQVMHQPTLQYAIEASYLGWVLISPRDDLTHELSAWKRTLRIVRYVYSQVPNKSSWLCIHSYEGSWTDPGAPYYGGLQMDSGFMGSYGWYLVRVKGTADHWTPLEQMWTAEYARGPGGRGFYPWPNTARYCGLI